MANKLRFGDASFDEAIDIVANELAVEKNKNYSNKAFLTGIEGLSSTGKSTMAGKLELALQNRSFYAFHIEGDLFQRSREESMKKYSALLDAVERGEPVPDDFPSTIWDYGKMTRELISPVVEFNQSGRELVYINLRNVLTSKKPGTEHDELHPLDRNTVILTTGMYLRHVPGFDYIVFLDVSPETSVKRKLERTAKTGVVRDPTITDKMVKLIESPIMIKHLQRNLVSRGMVLDVSDFDKVSIYDIDGYKSPYN